MKNLNINWQKLNGLLPVIVSQNGEVLMLAYMNEEALNLSLETGFAHYFSRTKNRIWKKGEESANTQKIISAKLDCDNDALLLEVKQNGVACHTGAKSCFFNEISKSQVATEIANIIAPSPLKYNVLDHLYHTALDRKLNGDKDSSYIAQLYKKGENSYLKKIAEESAEFIMAIKDLNLANSVATQNGEHKELFKSVFNKDGSGVEVCRFDAVYEAADLIFHLIVALADHDIHPEQILRELERRNGLSGIAEKNSRSGDGDSVK